MKNNKKMIAIIAVVVIGVIGISSYVILKPKPQANLIFKDNIVFEYSQSLYKEDSNDLDIITIDDFIDKDHEESIYDEVSFEKIIIDDDKSDKSNQNKPDEGKDKSKDEEESKDKEIKKIDVDTSKIGKGFKVKIYARLESEVSEFEAEYEVKDTQMPEFTGEFEITITDGDALDLNEYIKAHDPVDGELTIEFDKDDFSQAGTYKVIAKAKDANDNESTQEITIIVQEKELVQENTAVTDNSNYNSNSSGSGNPTPPKSAHECDLNYANGVDGYCLGGVWYNNNNDYTGSGEVVAEGIIYNYREGNMFVFNTPVGIVTYARSEKGSLNGNFSYNASDLSDSKLDASHY